MTDDIRDDLFTSCAFVVFTEVAKERQGWPDSKAVKARAYELYEAELAAKTSARQLTD